MRPLAVMAAFVLAAAALPTSQALSQAAGPAQLNAWTGRLYADFGLDLFYPLGLKATEKRAIESGARTLSVIIPLEAGQVFMAEVVERPADWEPLETERALEDYVRDQKPVGLREVSAVNGRAWEFDTVYEGRLVRNHLVLLMRRGYLLRSVSGPSGGFDPGTHRFFSSALIFP